MSKSAGEKTAEESFDTRMHENNIVLCRLFSQKEGWLMLLRVSSVKRRKEVKRSFIILTCLYSPLFARRCVFYLEEYLLSIHWSVTRTFVAHAYFFSILCACWTDGFGRVPTLALASDEILTNSPVRPCRFYFTWIHTYTVHTHVGVDVLCKLSMLKDVHTYIMNT